jgi:WD40 repeat protein
MAFSPDGTLVAAAKSGRLLALWDTGTGALIRELALDHVISYLCLVLLIRLV